MATTILQAIKGQDAMQPKILFVVTSHREMGPWLEELAVPYLALEALGLSPDLASPAGGETVPDPLSLESPWLTDAGQDFLSNEAAMRKMNSTQRLADIDPAGVDAVYLVGGTGTLWDFPNCEPLVEMLSALARDGKPIAAICHGVVGLLHARDGSGDPLVRGRSITCFSDAEERMLGMEDAVPLLAETALRRQGAIVSCAPPFQAQVVIDRPLLTGQNPASAAALAVSLAEIVRSPRHNPNAT